MTKLPERWIEGAHNDADVDEQGRPLHPEKGYPICAHPKSEKTSPTEHGRERDDVPYCLQRAGWGTERDVGCCRKHGAPSSTRKGPLNPNYRTGLYAEIDADAYKQEDLELMQSLHETDEVELLEQLIRIHAFRYKRAHGELPAGLKIKANREDSTDQVYTEINLQPAEMQLASLGSQLASLIQRYHKITEGEQLNIDQSTEISGEASISVEWQVSQREKEDQDGDE